MIRRAIPVLLACGVGLGCGGAKPKSESDSGGYLSLFVAHVARGGGTFPVPALDGDVTCYGGELVGAQGPGQVEMYLRRAVSPSSGAIENDLVVLYRVNPQVFRYAYTIGPGEYSLRDVTEVNGVFGGKAVVAGDILSSFMALDGAFTVQIEETVDGGLTVASVVFLSTLAERFNLRLSWMSTIEEATAILDSTSVIMNAEAASLEEYDAALQREIAGLEAAIAAKDPTLAPPAALPPDSLTGMVAISRGDLVVIPEPACAEMFAKFPTL